MVRRLSHLVEITACDDPNGVVGVALKFILVFQHGSLEPTVPVEGLDLRGEVSPEGFSYACTPLFKVDETTIDVTMEKPLLCLAE